MSDAAKSIPPTIRGQKYVSLITVRKNGTKVATPVWFGEDDNRLYVMTRSTMGKVKRIRNNPLVEVAPCTVTGKITGDRFFAQARVLPLEEQAHARQTINRKYWLARVPLIWWRTDTYLELSFP
ncbi:MAG TPA: PPOX class F420-dependent oxidoreductase [Candidatus Deferrimicrobiaceae bacterium]|jgi:PPOX class probable F420-dependent enzyme|nr:PPOX class F420-dependent oxidoreductase [Candidatus Deferrimicrobiaceae bacterium]